MTEEEIQAAQQTIEPIYQRNAAQYEQVIMTLKAKLPKIRHKADLGCARLGEHEADELLTHLVMTLEYLVEHGELKRVRDDLQDGLIHCEGMGADDEK